MKIWQYVRANLTLQILIAVFLAFIVGTLLRGHDLKAMSALGKLVINWLKLVAGPFLFFTILASLLEVSIRWSQGLRLIGIAFLNTSLALTIGIVLTKVFLEGQQWPAGVDKIVAAAIPQNVALDFDSWVKTFTPQSFFEPFVKNEILLIALLAVLIGIAARSAFLKESPKLIQSWIRGAEACRSLLAKILLWIVALTPFAIFGVMTATIAEFGFGIFGVIGPFFAVICLGFALQIIFVYGFWVFIVAKIKPSRFFAEAKEAVLYSLGVNSSLATLPLTLKALKQLGVSDRSASLGAGVATNLNNDGIVLYEALAVYFTAIVLVGQPMDLSQMIVAALVCVVASMGITGIPDAGYISLAVVIGAMKLPTELLPLLLSIDWIVARLRSAVNVLSDMTLSIAVDAFPEKKDPAKWPGPELT